MNYSFLFKLFLTGLCVTALGIYSIQSGFLDVTDVTRDCCHQGMTLYSILVIFVCHFLAFRPPVVLQIRLIGDFFFSFLFFFCSTRRLQFSKQRSVVIYSEYCLYTEYSSVSFHMTSYLWYVPYFWILFCIILYDLLSVICTLFLNTLLYHFIWPLICDMYLISEYSSVSFYMTSYLWYVPYFWILFCIILYDLLSVIFTLLLPLCFRRLYDRNIGPFPSKNRSSCSCEGYTLNAQHVPADELEDLQRRRSEEYRQYQLRSKNIQVNSRYS